MTQEFLINNSWLIAIAVSSGLMLFVPVLTKGSAARVSSAQATMLINQRKAVLVDIRDDATASKHGYMPNAVRVDLKSLKDKADSLAKNKEIPLVVVCQTGQRAGAAVTVLKGCGYKEVSVLDGGVQAWKEAGLPTKSQPSEPKAKQAKSKAA